MNAIYFCNKVREYKEKKEELSHAISLVDKVNNALVKKTGTTKYYTKIDDYYAPGVNKYFWSEEEYRTFLDNQKPKDAKLDAKLKPFHAKYTEQKKNTDMQKGAQNKQLGAGYDAWKASKEEDKKQAAKIIAAMARYDNPETYDKNKDYHENAEATRYDKMKDRTAEAQSGREAAIRKSSRSTEEQAREIIDTHQKKELYDKGIKMLENKFGITKKKAERNVAAEQKGKENAIKKSLSENQAKENLNEARRYANVPGYGTLKKLQNEQTKKANYAKQHEAELTAELNVSKALQKEELENNKKEINNYLNKIKNKQNLTVADINKIKSNPLYDSINVMMKAEDPDINDFLSYISQAVAVRNNSTEKWVNERVDKVNNVINDLSDGINKSIDAQTIDEIVNKRVVEGRII